MTNAGRMIPVVESDRASRPWVVFGFYGLYGVYLPQCLFHLLLGYMGDIDHVHSLDLGKELLLASIIWATGLLVVFNLWGPVFSLVASLRACLKTQQLWLVWVPILSWLP